MADHTERIWPDRLHGSNVSSERLVWLRVPTGVSKGPRRPKRRVESEDELWLVSYADLLTLLFCFFALLLSVSRFDAAKLDSLNVSMNRQFRTEKQTPSTLDTIRTELQQALDDAGIHDGVYMRLSDKGLVVDLNAQILFDPASAVMNERYKTIVDTIAVPLIKEPVDIQVEGHTDPLPIKSELYPSNWELSAARASSVVRYLANFHGFEPRRLRAVGLADTVAVDEDGVPIATPLPTSQWTDPYLARQRRVTLLLIPRAIQGPTESHSR